MEIENQDRPDSTRRGRGDLGSASHRLLCVLPEPGLLLEVPGLQGFRVLRGLGFKGLGA